MAAVFVILGESHKEPALELLFPKTLLLSLFLNEVAHGLINRKTTALLNCIRLGFF